MDEKRAHIYASRGVRFLCMQLFRAGKPASSPVDKESLRSARLRALSKASWDSRDDEADRDCEEGADDDNDDRDKDEEDEGARGYPSHAPHDATTITITRTATAATAATTASGISPGDGGRPPRGPGGGGTGGMLQGAAGMNAGVAVPFLALAARLTATGRMAETVATARQGRSVVLGASPTPTRIATPVRKGDHSFPLCRTLWRNTAGG